MRKEFVMRGQTNSGETEVLEFGKYKEGYAYRMTEFSLFPSTSIGSAGWEIVGSVTAGKTAVAPTDPNFDNDGLIATSMFVGQNNFPDATNSILNNTFLITQNLILMVLDTSSAGAPVNWQCRFESVKMSKAEEAAVNYKQFSVFDE